MEQNCDKCVPCREGLWRLKEMIDKKKIDEKVLNDIIFTLKETSLCGLGKIAGIPLNSLINKVCKSSLTAKK
jgi:NADH:ubiquinone oxidoreductase subunit F (NADH-binding)